MIAEAESPMTAAYHVATISLVFCHQAAVLYFLFSASIMIPSGDSGSVSPICVLSTIEMMTR